MALIIERSTITGKGQVQIPAKIRQAAGVAIGDEVAFKLGETGRVEIEFIKKRPLADFAGALPPRKKYPGLEEEEKLARQMVAENAVNGYE